MRTLVIDALRDQAELAAYYAAPHDTTPALAGRLLNVFDVQLPFGRWGRGGAYEYGLGVVVPERVAWRQGAEPVEPTLAARLDRAPDARALAARIYAFMPELREIVEHARVEGFPDAAGFRGAVLCGGLVSAALMTDASRK